MSRWIKTLIKTIGNRKLLLMVALFWWESGEVVQAKFPLNVNPAELGITENGATKIQAVPLTKEANLWLKEVENIPPEKYSALVEIHRVKMELYIEENVRRCQTVTEKVGREACFLSLKMLEKSFIDKMLISRIRYLDYLHGRRVRSLKKARIELMDNLDQVFLRKVAEKKE